MKKNIAFRLGITVLILTLLSACVVGGTFAKYTTTVNGTGSVAVASWSFNAGNAADPVGTEDFTVALAGTGAGGDLLPGDTGTFTLYMDADGAETDIDVVIALTAIPKNMTLKLTNADGATLGLTATGQIKGTINYSATEGDMEASVVIYWTFADLNAVDAGQTNSLAFTVTGTQANNGVAAVTETSAFAWVANS